MDILYYGVDDENGRISHLISPGEFYIAHQFRPRYFLFDMDDQTISQHVLALEKLCLTRGGNEIMTLRLDSKQEAILRTLANMAIHRDSTKLELNIREVLTDKPLLNRVKFYEGAFNILRYIE